MNSDVEPLAASARALPASTQAELVRRAARGDAPAFEQLVTPRADRAFRIARAILGSDADARDTHILDHTNELAADGARLERRLSSVEPEVAAAGAREHDANDGIGGIGDNWVGAVPDQDTAGCVDDRGTHRAATLSARHRQASFTSS